MHIGTASPVWHDRVWPRGKKFWLFISGALFNAIIVYFPMKLSEYLVILEHWSDGHSTMVTSGLDTSAQSTFAVTDGRQL